MTSAEAPTFMAISLPILEPPPPAEGRKPGWLKVRAPGGPNYIRLQSLIRGQNLHTVCEEAHCPNIGECWQDGTATFMILGDVCTRHCGYCAVTHGKPRWEDREEPERIGRAAVPRLLTKTGIILGLGETRDELAATLRDLRGVDVRILSLGQYLRPSAQHLPVARYYHPDEFAELAEIGRGLGFAHVESGPLVRSSYHAKRQVQLAAEPPARQP